MKNNKSLGQHWLKDRGVLMEIAALAAVNNQFSSSDSLRAENHTQEERKRGECVPSLSKVTGVVLEIGPGLGTLTSVLFKYFKKVISVEFDEKLAKNLPGSFPGKNLEVIHANILDFDLNTLPKDYVAVGNIPYYITSPIIQKFLSAENKPRRIVFLVQKEVAERIAAPVGRHTILSISSQAYAKTSLGPVVPRALFTPPPKVDSQVIILDPYETPLISEDVIRFAKIGFSSPRKKLAANLSAGLKLPRAELNEILASLCIDPSARPADLSLEDWQNLFKTLKIKP